MFWLFHLYMVIKQALFCMLCSLGVAIRTSDSVIAAIMAVHAICGTLMSGGQAEGGGSQSATDLGLSSACKRFNKLTYAGVFVGINQFPSCTGKNAGGVQPSDSCFSFLWVMFSDNLLFGGFLCDVLPYINQLLQIWKQLWTLLKCHE